MKNPSLIVLVTGCIWAFGAICTPADHLYVWTNSLYPGSPFSSWDTAAHTIQDAVDDATDGDVVWVTNGVYDSGGSRAILSLLTNRVNVYKPITVRSVNGPAYTTILGSGPAGPAAVRGAHLEDGSSLVGFTVTSGHTYSAGHEYYDRRGGGIAAYDGSVISNCIIAGNVVVDSFYGGGGVFGGVVYDSVITGNSAEGTDGKGGGAAFSTLHHCLISGNSATSHGGGTYSCDLYSCTVSANRAMGEYATGGGASQGLLYGCLIVSNLTYTDGGGTYGCELDSCTVSANRAVGEASGGGGASAGSLYNCLIVSNVAAAGGGGLRSSEATNCVVYGNRATNEFAYGGGAEFCTLINCTVSSNASAYEAGGVYMCGVTNSIVYANQAPANANYSDSEFAYSCTRPHPGGTGNMTNNPLFIGSGNYRLQAGSPCVNKGTNDPWMAKATDPDGKPRVIGGQVDMGAYESGTPTDFQLWLQSYALATDGSADYDDGDNDLYNNWQEWRAMTVPTNELSYFRFEQAGSVSPAGWVVQWPSVTGRTYAIERGTNLLSNPPFQSLASGVAGQPLATEYTDTTANAGSLRIYRVRVEP